MTENKSEHSVPEPSLKWPPKFLVGVAVSVYQNSGDPNSNWAWFEKQKPVSVDLRLRLSTDDLTQPDVFDDYNESVQTIWRNAGPSIIQNGYKCGNGSDFWNMYEQDIKLAKDVGCNSFRLSLEWSRIMPHARGEVDEEAIAHYHKIFDCIEKHGMEANVTLHWFVHPRWFDHLGGFDRAANIPIYVEWAKLAFHHFGKRSKLWATFNEPAVASMCGYVTGNHPPGQLCKFRKAALHLLYMLRAHSEAYRAIKEMPGGKTTAVGIVHNVFWTEPKHKGLLYTHVKAAVAVGNNLWGNETVMNYLKIGTFFQWVPIGRRVKWKDPHGPPGCDFFGLNHYSRGIVDWKLNPSNRGPRAPSDMGYPIYPPSIYRAISYASTLGKPIYIMENGMPSSEDNEERKEWIDGYLGQVQKAVEDGYDVRGFFYWTLVDNFEWSLGYDLKFGLYEWNPDWPDHKQRKLREGAKAIIPWYKELPEKLGGYLSTTDKPGKRAPGGPTERRGGRGDKERQQEIEYLRQQGNTEEDIKEYLPEEEDPVTAGVEAPSESDEDAEDLQDGEGKP
jgi:beta-glucosidase/6-phospho-beta-glucosidase/beta-galactosidase